MTIRTKEQSRAAMLQVLETRGSGIRDDAGEPIVDLIDGVAIESERSSVVAEYQRRINSLSGFRSVVQDETFKRQLADAYGIGYDRVNADYLRRIGAPTDMPSDIEGRIFVDLSDFALGVGRRRRAATFASTLMRLTLTSGSPYTLARGASFRRGSASTVLYDTTQALSAVTPSVDLGTGSFYVDVAARCRQPGRVGNAIVNVINATTGTLTGVQSVRNVTAATGGRERETNTELLGRLALALSGTNINTWRGLLDFVLEQDEVEDAILVRPGDPLMTRSAAGAVDVYIIGSRLTSQTATTTIESDSPPESYTLPLQPVQTINSVVDDSSNQYFDGGGYTFVPDAGSRRGSTRAHAQIQWDAPSPGGVGPVAASVMTIAYIHDALIRDLQRRLDDDPVNNIPASDILIRQSTLVSVNSQMQVVPVAGISDLGLTQQDVNDAVESALTAYFAGLKLGEQSDFSDALRVAAEVRIGGVEVVDRVEGFAMGKVGSPLGYESLTVAGNEYLRLNDITFLV